MSLRDREKRLQTPSGPAERSFTLELRLMCPEDPRHHVGTLQATSGNRWAVQLEPSSTQTRSSRSQLRAQHDADPPRPTCRHCGEPAGDSVFAVIGEAEVDCPDHDPGPRVPATQGSRRRSVLRFEGNSNTGQHAARLRWECSHCAEVWGRTNTRGGVRRQDNVLRADRVLRVLHLMREHGPSRLSVEIDAQALDDLARRITQEGAGG